MGAAIYWIPSMHDVGVDGKRNVERGSGWLKQGAEIPVARRGLAASISTMVCFDYLIGNWDRFSGGNARGNDVGTWVYMRDHDLAFPARMNESLHRRVLQPMLRAERFSASFYAAVKALDRQSFAAALEDELDRHPEPLLDTARIDGVMDRRSTLLSHVESLIQLHGRSQVLAFE